MVRQNNNPYLLLCFRGVEYFCCSCRQLRLGVKGKIFHCGNCYSKDIIRGEPGTLDKDALIRKLDGGKG